MLARRSGVWIAAYAVVILLFAASALDAHRDRERMREWEAKERLELVRRAEAALAPLELAAAQEDMAYQMIHVAHAWAHGNRRLARARERALARLEARFESALREARRARAR